MCSSSVWRNYWSYPDLARSLEEHISGAVDPLECPTAFHSKIPFASCSDQLLDDIYVVTSMCVPYVARYATMMHSVTAEPGH